MPTSGFIVIACKPLCNEINDLRSKVGVLIAQVYT